MRNLQQHKKTFKISRGIIIFMSQLSLSVIRKNIQGKSTKN